MIWPLLWILSLSARAPAQSVCDIGNWTRPNDKDLNATVRPADYDCGDTCQTVLTAAITSDRQTIYGKIPFNESLYATTPNFSAITDKPGDLLSFQRQVNISTTWQLPGGTTLYQIQYVSTGINNTPVPATAFIALPYVRPGNNQTRKFPVVGWAHGTIGVLPGCAASSSFDLYDYDTWKPMLFQGYAIVATDYQGLGNNYTAHPYQACTVQAADVYYSVVAAKRALPNLLSGKWIAAGHSQGGGAVLALGTSDLVKQHEGCEEDGLQFLGSVPMSPAGRLADLVQYDAERVAQYGVVGALYAPFIYWALEVMEPGSGKGFLTDEMIRRIELGKAIEACFSAFGGLGFDIVLSKGPEGVFRNVSSLGTYEPLVRFQRKYGGGLGKAAAAPMLIIQGESDTTVAANVTERAWEATCKASGKSGPPVQLSLYPGLDHSATPAAAAPEWLAWIADRFAGRPLHHSEEKCQKVTVEPVDIDAAFRPADF